MTSTRTRHNMELLPSGTGGGPLSKRIGTATPSSQGNIGARTPGRLMLAPVAPPTIPRSTVKTKPPAATKETSSRPTKKLAKEPDAVSSLAAVATLKTPAPASSRGESPTQSMSPVHVQREQHEVRTASIKTTKKPEIPVKSKLPAPGTQRRQLRETTVRLTRPTNNDKSQRSFPATSSKLSTPNSHDSNEGPSKSGAGHVVKMDDSEPLDQTSEQILASTSDTAERVFSDFAPTEADQQRLQYENQIRDLNLQLKNIATELETACHEKALLNQSKVQLEEAKMLLEGEKTQLAGEKMHLEGLYNTTVHEIQTISHEKQQFQAQCLQLEDANKRLMEENITGKGQLEQLRAGHSELCANLLSLESTVASLNAERDAAVQKAVDFEQRLCKCMEDYDSLKKDMQLMKKKHQEERDRAVEQVAALDKLCKTRSDEANSWQVVGDLRLEDIRRLQKELVAAQVIVERHSICEAELKRQELTVISLRTKIDACATAEKEYRGQIEQKDNELREVRRRSTTLLQEKDTLKFQLDSLKENDVLD